MYGNDFYEDKLSRVGRQRGSMTLEQKDRISEHAIEYLWDLDAYMNQNPAFSEYDRLTRSKEDWERPNGQIRIVGSVLVVVGFYTAVNRLFPTDSMIMEMTLIIGSAWVFYGARTKRVKMREEAEKIREEELYKALQDHYKAYPGERLLSSYEVTRERISEYRMILSSGRA